MKAEKLRKWADLFLKQAETLNKHLDLLISLESEPKSDDHEAKPLNVIHGIKNNVRSFPLAVKENIRLFGKPGKMADTSDKTMDEKTFWAWIEIVESWAVALRNILELLLEDNPRGVEIDLNKAEFGYPGDYFDSLRMNLGSFFSVLDRHVKITARNRLLLVGKEE